MASGRSQGRRSAALLLVGVGAMAGGLEGYRQWDVAQRVAACDAEGVGSAELEAWLVELERR